MVLDSLSAADRVNLLELYARSVMLLELGRCEEWADLFEPLALVRTTCIHRPSVVEQFKGRSDLLALGRRMIDGDFDLVAGPRTPRSRCRHTLSNITLFGGDPRCASGYAYLTVTTIAGAEPPRWLASGLYSDRLNKCGSGCWRFASRMFIADGATNGSAIANPPSTVQATAT